MQIINDRDKSGGRKSLDLKTFLRSTNSKHPTIRFGIELPDADGFLPILDIKLKIKDDGTMERKLYTKPANKGITLNYKLHHQSATKRAVARMELKRAIHTTQVGNMRN